MPYAQRDHEHHAALVRARLARAEVTVRSLHEARHPHNAIREARAIFVGDGNSFVLLKQLYDRGLLEPVRERIWGGVPYLGVGAGSQLASAGIHTTNDMPIVMPPSLRALEILPFHINPHYPAPDSHTETRDHRIAEFHDHNEAPVIGLCAGAALRLEGRRLALVGAARLFRRGEVSRALEPGARLDDLLAGASHDR